MCNDFLLWWLVEAVWFSDSPKVFLNLSSNLDVLCQGWSSQNLISSNKFYLFTPRFLELSPIWARWSLSLWALSCGILTRLFFVHLIKVCYHKSSFPNFSLPRTRRIRGVMRVILCSRIGGISTGQKKNWSDIHSNEANKILWLKAPFLWSDSCNSSWNPSTVKWSNATVTQRFLPPFSVPLIQ